MSAPVINGYEVDASVFERLAELIEPAGTAKSFLMDGNFDSNEIDSFLDDNHDGHRRLEDFMSLSSKLKKEGFQEFSSILLQSDKNIYSRCESLWDAIPEDTIVRPFSAREGNNFYYDAIYGDKAFAEQVIWIGAIKFFHWLSFYYPQYRHDPDVMALYLKKVPENIPYLHKDVLHDKDVLLRWVEECVRLDEYQAIQQVLNDQLRSGEKIDDEILVGLCLKNHNMIRFLPYELQAQVWEKVASVLKAKDLFEPEYLTSYVRFESYIHRLTEFPDRFQSFETLATLMRDRHNEDDPRPVILLLYSTSDHNGAFGYYPLADRFVQDGRYRIVYKEISNEDALYDTVLLTSKFGERPLAGLVVAGHGYPYGIALGGRDRRIYSYDYADGEKKYLDTEDFYQRKFRKLYRYLSPEAQVLFYSCSTAQGNEKAYYNMANTAAYNLSKKQRLYASQLPSNIRQFYIDDGGNWNVRWYQSEAYYMSYGHRLIHSRG